MAATLERVAPTDERADAGDGGRPSIELREVRKLYGSVVAVERLSLSVARGEFVTLLGPSGCGKTTTLRMIGGFELPTAGEVYIDGEAMGARPPYRRNVNTVFQHYALFPHLSVGQNVGYGLTMKKVSKADRRRRVAEALEMVRLPQVEKRKPSELSGGQQQRVALARALVNRPAVLLLDEPLGALDLKLRQAMQSELKALNREIGATFVYVTHDQDEALTMSDRIAVMREGRILQIGTPAEIYERPRNRFVADFVGQTNFFDGVMTGVSGGVAEIDVPGAGVVRAMVPAGTAGERTGKATVAVRPERVVFAAPQETAGADLNLLAGTIAEVLYLGTHTRYLVRLPGGGSVLLHRQNAGSEHSGGVGDSVWVAFEPASATVLTD